MEYLTTFLGKVGEGLQLAGSATMAAASSMAGTAATTSTFMSGPLWVAANIVGVIVTGILASLLVTGTIDFPGLTPVVDALRRWRAVRSTPVCRRHPFGVLDR